MLFRSAAAVMGKFQREKVIPEVDAYRLSALATMAITADKAVTYSYTPEKVTILDALKDAIAKVKEAGFIGQPMVIQISTAAMTAFEKALGSNNIKEEKFTAGGFDTRCAFLDGIPMIQFPGHRGLFGDNKRSGHGPFSFMGSGPALHREKSLPDVPVVVPEFVEPASVSVIKSLSKEIFMTSPDE